MNQYQVYCREAREVGAIGIFYAVAVMVEATTVREAEAKFRERYETRFGPVFVNGKANN
jgi:hypothetical protein